MEQSLLSAVSGIEADQTYLNVVGNNVANADTTAYKSENAEFVDLLAEQIAGASAPIGGGQGAGVDPIDVGSGVRIGAVTEDLSQGTLEQTGVASDVAIQGGGYLVVQQNGQTYYTRNGQLTLDANGDLATTTGGLVQGWMANAGQIDTNAPTGPVTIPTDATMPANATTKMAVGGNLDSSAAAGSQATVTINAYDALGDAVPVTLTFTSNGGGTWGVSATGVTIPAGTTVGFNSTGTDAGQVDLATSTGLTQNADGSFTIAATGPDGTINLDFPADGSTGALTQFAGSSSVQVNSQDGYASGSLASYSIGSDGIITGSFTNGETLAIGQIALANFANPGGLALDGNTLYSATANSGQAQIGTPGSGGLGTLVGGSLESSNVDLASQLTDLIVAQESYSANTKVVSTTSANLQALTQMA